MPQRTKARERKRQLRESTKEIELPRWQVQDAKARFSEVFRRALNSPQEISRHGRDRVIMVRADEFRRLKSRALARNLVELLQESPLHGLKIDLESRRDFGRKVNL